MSDLSKIAAKSESVYNWTNVICNSLFMIAVLAIFTISIKQGTFKYLPNSLKVCLIGFFIGYTAFQINSIHMVVTDSYWNTSQLQEPGYEVMSLIGSVLFMVSHWLFTSHYLSTACLFNLIYSDEELQETRRIKLRLLILDILTYSIAILLPLFALIISETRIVIDVYFALQLWQITGFSGYSFWNIYQRTRQLEKVGIFANWKFMAFYFAFIFTNALLSTLAAILDLCLLFWSEDPPSNRDYSIEIAARVCNCTITIIFLLLNFMMLALYYKFSKLKRVMTAMALDRVAKHMKVSNVSELEREERERAERRVKAYRQMADEQIKHMIDTIMSLSHLDKSATNPSQNLIHDSYRNNEDGDLVSEGEDQLRAMSEVSKSSDDEFLLAFEQGILNAVRQREATAEIQKQQVEDERPHKPKITGRDSVQVNINRMTYELPRERSASNFDTLLKR